MSTDSDMGKCSYSSFYDNDAAPHKRPKITSIKYLSLFLAHRDSSQFLESFDIVYIHGAKLKSFTILHPDIVPDIVCTCSFQTVNLCSETGSHVTDLLPINKSFFSTRYFFSLVHPNLLL